jgi:hypothetical protein
MSSYWNPFTTPYIVTINWISKCNETSFRVKHGENEIKHEIIFGKTAFIDILYFLSLNNYISELDIGHKYNLCFYSQQEYNEFCDRFFERLKKDGNEIL